MQMSLGMSLGMEMQLALAVVGGATESIFPEVEALLLSGGDYQLALEFVAARKNMNRYHSVIDFLFCELHLEWQMACRRFYADKGPRLMEQITVEQRAEYAKRLVVALAVARGIFCEKRRQSWCAYRKEVEDAIRAAA